MGKTCFRPTLTCLILKGTLLQVATGPSGLSGSSGSSGNHFAGLRRAPIEIGQEVLVEMEGFEEQKW